MIVKPKKALGQCFLTNPRIAQRIADEIDEPNTIVVEIGPGTGALTKEIASHKNLSHLLAIEKDQELFKMLTETYIGWDNKITILCGDATKINIRSALEEIGLVEQCNKQEVVMLSNLPYNVGTQIVINTIARCKVFKKIVVMLQEEVANRIVAKPSTKSYSTLSVMAQALCNVSKIMSVSPGSFRPAPKVFSAVVKLEPKPRGVSIGQDVFEVLEKITVAGFGNRRKKFLKNIMSLQDSTITSVIEKHIEENQRIEELQADFLVKMAKEIVYENKLRAQQ